MAITNFQQTVWSKVIQTQLETITSLKDHCDYSFQGEAKMAERVKILGVAKPTISTYVPGTDLTRESGKDNSQFLDIDQYKYFNIEVEDIDQAQGVAGLMEALTKEATIALSEEADKYVASVIKAAASQVDGVKMDISAVTDGGISHLEQAFKKLYENNVRPNSKFWLEISPEWYTLLRPAILELDTNNTEMIKSGAVGKYGNALITIENNLPQTVTVDSQACTYVNILRTDKAVAFVGAIDKVEAYRPDDAFSDALKGLYVYGAKLVRPEQVCLIGVY